MGGGPATDVLFWWHGGSVARRFLEREDDSHFMNCHFVHLASGKERGSRYLEAGLLRFLGVVVERIMKSQSCVRISSLCNHRVN